MKMLYEVYWSAAMIEGEGSFALRSRIHPGIVVTNTDMEILHHLQRLWGGNIYESKHSGVVTRKPCFSWNLNANQAIGLMMTIYPLMTTRRQKRIREVITVWRSTNTRVYLRDSEALVALRRVFGGEHLRRVAEDICIAPLTLQSWMAGRQRPELLEQLKRDNEFSPYIFARFDARRAALAKRTPCSDVDALEGVRAIKQKGKSIKSVSKKLGVSFHTVKGWATGQYRPYLLAQILQEEQQHQEVPVYASQQ